MTALLPNCFCRYVCKSCEAEARRHYNPAIFRSGTAYAASGEEKLIGIEDDND